MSSYQFHCGHSDFKRNGPFVQCLVCGSLVDALHSQTVPAYDASYPKLRGHFDEGVQRLKVTSAKNWLRRLGTKLTGKTICEVGFGGGGVLLDMAKQGNEVFGIEANHANVEHALEQGLSPKQLYFFDNLPERLPRQIEVWLFLDSFEHLPDPTGFVDWMVANSGPNSSVMLVLPRADSISRRLLGSLWPHRLADHAFHWSRSGIVEVFARKDFELRQSFYPWKWISLAMVKRHLDHKFNIHSTIALPFDAAFPFNIGQQGLLFQRKAAQ